MMSAIRDWLRKCPLIDQNDRFCVDWLDAEPLAYTIEETPNTAVIRQYLDGTTMREKVWVLAAVQDYSSDTLQQIANSGFWEQLADWVEAQNKAKNFPTVPDGCTPEKIEISTTHYLYRVGANTARYQVQMKMRYYKKG